MLEFDQKKQQKLYLKALFDYDLLVKNKTNSNLSFKEIVENLCQKEMQRFMKIHFWTKEGK